MVLNSILLLTTRSRLSIAQASSSFKLFDTRTFTYATPTFITEALSVVTQVQVFLTDCYSESTPYIALANS